MAFPTKTPIPSPKIFPRNLQTFAISWTVLSGQRLSIKWHVNWIKCEQTWNSFQKGIITNTIFQAKKQKWHNTSYIVILWFIFLLFPSSQYDVTPCLKPPFSSSQLPCTLHISCTTRAAAGCPEVRRRCNTSEPGLGGNGTTGPNTSANKTQLFHELTYYHSIGWEPMISWCSTRNPSLSVRESRWAQLSWERWICFNPNLQKAYWKVLCSSSCTILQTWQTYIISKYMSCTRN